MFYAQNGVVIKMTSGLGFVLMRVVFFPPVNNTQ